MVLTILADGGSARRCQATAGSREIYLKDVGVLGFLKEHNIVGINMCSRVLVVRKPDS